MCRATKRSERLPANDRRWPCRVLYTRLRGAGSVYTCSLENRFARWRWFRVPVDRGSWIVALTFYNPDRIRLKKTKPIGMLPRTRIVCPSRMNVLHESIGNQSDFPMGNRYHVRCRRCCRTHVQRLFLIVLVGVFFSKREIVEMTPVKPCVRRTSIRLRRQKIWKRRTRGRNGKCSFPAYRIRQWDGRTNRPDEQQVTWDVKIGLQSCLFVDCARDVKS